MREQTPRISGSKAIVVGAGISGLLSARVLSDHFDDVLVLDRDALPEGPDGRRGVPQGRHLHSLATKGSELLEDLFPGLDAELADAGAPLLDQALDAVTVLPDGNLPRFDSGIRMRSVSRDLLEWRIRRRVFSLQNVGFLQGAEVTALTPDSGHGLSGVVTRTKGRDANAMELHAALVVDASGNASRAPEWLKDIGYSAPEETVVDARLGYATRWYKVPSGFDGGWESLAVLPGWPDNPRGGSLRKVEGNRWTAVLLGIGGDYPPTDADAFLEFAKTLPSGLLHEAIRDAEPVSPVHGYRRTANRRRHYEKLRLPDNFLVTGDSACVMNPSYGQGMTMAAISAVALRETLERGKKDLPDLSRGFHRRQARATLPAWTTTTNSDRQWSAKSLKELGRGRRFLHRVSGEVMKTATADRDTARKLLEVKNLLASPASVARPGLIVPAILRSL